MTWHPDRLPSLDGRVAVVTGANSGLGLATSTALARAGAHVVLTSRDAGRGDAAVDRLRAAVPGASAEVRELDLADLASVRSFADGVTSDHPRMHLLVNNAGVMATPRRRTADGFELQLGTNHLGHVALTARLLPALVAGGEGVTEPGARIVTLSSLAHQGGRLDRSDLMGERRYHRAAAYARSKLANLLFAFELARRLAAGGVPVESTAAHPGLSATNLGKGVVMGLPRALERPVRGLYSLFSQGAEAGSWPTLRAATDDEAVNGAYYGPGGPGETRGPAVRVTSSARSHDADDARWLWTESERLTGVTFDLPPG